MRKSSQIHVDKGQEWPAIFLTPLNYGETDGSPARTKFLFQDGSLIVIIASLLLNLVSLFRENFSLLPYFDFPVNFEARITRTTRIAHNHRGIHAYG